MAKNKNNNDELEKVLEDSYDDLEEENKNIAIDEKDVNEDIEEEIVEQKIDDVNEEALDDLKEEIEAETIDNDDKSIEDNVIENVEDVKKQTEEITEDVLVEDEATTTKESSINDKSDVIEKDKKYDAVEKYVLTQTTISISQIQKQFKIGYKRASNILNTLEANNIIATEGNSKKRIVLANVTSSEESIDNDEKDIVSDDTSKEMISDGVNDDTNKEMISDDVNDDTNKEMINDDVNDEEIVIEDDEVIKAETTGDDVFETVEETNDSNGENSNFVDNEESEIHHQKILSIKEILIGLGVIVALIIAMAVSNNVSQSSQEQKLIDEYTLPIRASFSNEVKKEPIEINDVAIVSFTGYMKGEEIENSSAKNARIIVGNSNIIDDFDEQIVGHKKGDKFDAVLTFPEDYPASELAGKEVTFKVIINNVFKLRELDNALVKEIAKEGKKVNNDALANLKTVEDLKNLIREQIEMQKQIEQYSQDGSEQQGNE